VQVLPKAAGAGVFHPQLLHSCEAGNNTRIFTASLNPGKEDQHPGTFNITTRADSNLLRFGFLLLKSCLKRATFFYG
jgi:hypothetical protein